MSISSPQVSGGANGQPVHLGLDKTETIVSELTASTSVQQLVGGDPDRLELIVLNLGADDVYVSPKTDVSTTKGIRVSSGGGQLILQRFYDHSLTGWQLFCVAASATSDLYILSVRRYS